MDIAMGAMIVQMTTNDIPPRMYLQLSRAVRQARSPGQLLGIEWE